MKSSRRLLATVGRSSQFLTPYAPTGLTGLYTHPAPRPYLIWLYSQTLERLKAFPEISVYRQSTEAITKHRFQVIEAAKPKGFDDWQVRIKKHIQENPKAYESRSRAKHFEVNGVTYVLTRQHEDIDDRDLEWDGEQVIDLGEGARGEDERTPVMDKVHEEARIARKEYETRDIRVEDEPSLTANQVEDIEKEMGAGLLEEVVTVAEGELQLIDIMLKGKVWEELEDKPVEGQWQYFERNTQVGATHTA